MTELSKDITMAIALSELKRVIDFNNNYRDKFFRLETLRIDPSIFPPVLSELPNLVSAVTSFLQKWVDSKSEGPDAVKGELDDLLIQTDKLDMQVLGQIMKRLKSLEASLIVIRRAVYYLEDFHDKYAEIGSIPVQTISNARSTIASILNHLEGEKEGMTALIARCNLYYQSHTMRQLDTDMKELSAISDRIRSSSRSVEQLTLAVIIMTLWLAIIAVASFAFQAKSSLTSLQWLTVSLTLLFVLPAGFVGTIVIVLLRKRIISQ